MTTEYYHASPRCDLNNIGISPDAPPHVSMAYQGWVYLGTYDYIFNEYLKYAAQCTYYVYRINTSAGYNFDRSLPGEQIRTQDTIKPCDIKMFTKVSNTPVVHPRTDEYKEWYREKGYEV